MRGVAFRYVPFLAGVACGCFAGDKGADLLSDENLIFYLDGNESQDDAQKGIRLNALLLRVWKRWHKDRS
jgi:hypothetical protein